MRQSYLPALGLLLLLLPGPPALAERMLLCPPPAPPRVPLLPPPEDPGETRATADWIEGDHRRIELRGNAEVRRGPGLLAGDRILLDRERDRAEAEGNIHLESGALEVRGEHAESDLATGLFDIRDTQYHEIRLPAQGRAERVHRDEPHITRLESATYSGCPADKEDWHLRAGRLTLNTETNQGTARNVTLWFKSVPLFYTPWYRFPLGPDRQSGFLPPSVGQSSSSGTEVATPYYLNLAPNYDATITPRYLERRGTQVATELRWLNRQGFWQAEYETLDDRRFDDRRTLSHLEHDGELGANWTTSIEASRVSDGDYFDDLTTDLSVGRRTHLLRRGDLRWREANTDFRVRVQNYQTLDETITPERRPYEQLPRITLNTGQDIGVFATELDSELVRYERVDSDETTRTRVVPAVGLPMETPGWFLRPRVAVDYTDYRIDRVVTEGDERISRTVPISSLDSGLVFERWTTGFRQTLEPRAFYVYIPEVDQDDIPIFDSSERDFSFAQMFRERRFTGGDRIGDTNQLTLAVTSRLFSRADGREVLRGSIGGIRYFADREITLPEEPVQERDSSDVVAELFASPHPSWRSNSMVQWDPDEEVVRQASTDLGYRGPGGGEARIGWRYTKQVREVVNASFVWPATLRWRVLGRSSYSLEAQQNLDTMAGVEYRSCCWRLRGVARQYLAGSDGELADSYYIELVLDGLGSLGDTGALVFPE